MSSVSPSNATFQGRAGGWPGQPTFTDPTKAYIVNPLTVNWKSGALVYNISGGFPIPGQGLLPLTLFITLSDPTRSGTPTVFVDTDNGRWSQDAETFATVGILQVYGITPIVPAGGGGPSLVSQVQVTVSSAQLLALAETPVQIIAAQGAGTIIVPVNVSYQYKFNTTNYSVPTNVDGRLFFQGDNITGSALGTGLGFNNTVSGANGSVDQFTILPTNLLAVDKRSKYENTPVMLGLWNDIGAVTDLTLGDGTIIVTVLYQVVQLK